MRKRLWPTVSLAAKCRVLFGVAVLLILSATLYLPWVQMGSLSETAEVRAAERQAWAARLTANLDSQDWPSAQSQLLRDWPDTAAALNIPDSAPRLCST